MCVSKGCFKKFVLDSIELPTEKVFYTKFKSGNVFLGNQNLKFRMIALRICFEEVGGP